MVNKEKWEVDYNLLEKPIIEKAAGAPAFVLDTRGCKKITPYFDGSGATPAANHTYQPCDEDGTVIPLSSAASFANGTAVDVGWPFYKITVDASWALVLGRI